jgi:hypothetical protein
MKTGSSQLRASRELHRTTSRVFSCRSGTFRVRRLWTLDHLSSIALAKEDGLSWTKSG